MYIKLDDILSKEIDNPDNLGCINLDYKGVNINVYGVLHAITGGTNRDYVNFVLDTIEKEKRIKFCEKSMKAMYKGLDVEVDDWLQIKPKEAFLMSFKSCTKFWYFHTLMKTIIREKLNKNSKFGFNNIKIPTELSGDRKFHLLEPKERRIFAGFPIPEQYFNLNLKRRRGKSNQKIQFADKDWDWLSFVEPYANIPMRSIHMIEYVTQYCIKNNIKEAAIFIGEIHNSDIEWFVNNKERLSENINQAAKTIENEVSELLENKHRYKYFYYILSLFSGALSGMLIYAFIAVLIMLYYS